MGSLGYTYRELSWFRGPWPLILREKLEREIESHEAFHREKAERSKETITYNNTSSPTARHQKNKIQALGKHKKSFCFTMIIKILKFPFTHLDRRSRKKEYEYLHEMARLGREHQNHLARTRLERMARRKEVLEKELEEKERAERDNSGPRHEFLPP